MENKDNQQPSATVETSDYSFNQEIPPVPTIYAPQSVIYQQSGDEVPIPKKKAHNYFLMILGILIFLAIMLPASNTSKNLAFPIIISGLFAGIKFFIDSILSSKRVNNIIIKMFVIFGGFGIGVVIFIVCLVAGAIVGFTKDPHPQSTG